jgi:nicotinate-nucleotide adenylyltransferase
MGGSYAPGTMAEERIGVFGGTFDPIHVAHVVSAVEARRALELDRVVLVPAGDPWQKRGSVTAPAADRLAMVEAAVKGIAGLEVSPIEVERDGPSYTHQTLETLAAPGRKLFLVVGADVATTMHSWVGIEQLPALATLVVVDRAPDPEGVLEASPVAVAAGARPPGEESLPAGWECVRLSIPRLDVSSTDLRARASRGWPLDGLVPPGAVRIIAERGLYRTGESDRSTWTGRVH